VLVDDKIRQMANEVTAGKKNDAGKSRAIYDYVLGKMTYDKITRAEGPGQHAARVRRGEGELHGFSCAVQFALPAPKASPAV